MKKNIMRRAAALALILALALALGGCAKREVDREALGWEEDWTALSDLMAVEPVEGFVLSRNNDALESQGIWVASWSAGEGEPYVNSDGDENTLYDAEIYILIEECKSEAAASAELQSLESRERDNYECGEKITSDYAGQEFGVFAMTNRDEDNPYARGAAALTVRGQCVIVVELLCQDSFGGDAVETVEGLLESIHYNAEVW